VSVEIEEICKAKARGSFLLRVDNLSRKVRKHMLDMEDEDELLIMMKMAKDWRLLASARDIFDVWINK
jgi:hypothetical protein